MKTGAITRGGNAHWGANQHAPAAGLIVICCTNPAKLRRRCRDSRRIGPGCNFPFWIDIHQWAVLGVPSAARSIPASERVGLEIAPGLRVRVPAPIVMQPAFGLEPLPRGTTGRGKRGRTREEAGTARRETDQAAPDSHFTRSTAPIARLNSFRASISQGVGVARSAGESD